jgi:hypothetical protein
LTFVQPIGSVRSFADHGTQRAFFSLSDSSSDGRLRLNIMISRRFLTTHILFIVERRQAVDHAFKMQHKMDKTAIT